MRAATIPAPTPDACEKFPKPGMEKASRACWIDILGNKKPRNSYIFKSDSEKGHSIFFYLRHKRLCFCCVIQPSCGQKPRILALMLCLQSVVSLT